MKVVIWKHSGGGEPEITLNELKGDWFVESVHKLFELSNFDLDDLFRTVVFECWCEVELSLAYDADPLDPYFALIKYEQLT